MNEQEKSPKFERDKKKKIKLILDSFINLINEKGFDNISVRNIAEKSKVSVGTIYRYYSYGKLSILSEFLKNASKKALNEEIIQALPKGDINNLINLYLSNLLKTYRKNLEIHRLLYLAAISKKVNLEFTHELILSMFEMSFERLFNTNFFRKFQKEEVKEKFIQIFYLVQSAIHRHLFFLPIFNNDEELIEYLSKIVLFLLREFNFAV